MAKHKAKAMSGLDVVNDHTLKVSLQAPSGTFPLIIGYHGFFPRPKSALRKQDWKAYKERPVGNGPYTMVEP